MIENRLNPEQLPLPLEAVQDEPLKRGGFTTPVDEQSSPATTETINLLKKQVSLLEQIVDSLDDLTTRVNDLDNDGYRGR
jgi:hypothetical protein